MDNVDILKKLNSIKDFCEKQSQMEDQCECIGFESDTGQWIVNPFRDPTDRFIVNPLEEYSAEELLGFLANYNTRK